ncbi:hypothetical protein [Sinomonas susongensis]|uniref:hypothetical protein n=1 Tax=Sinomonas susongensis TaxID=1324851 RepID=UPI0011083D14|nr:hypothetical protein [Sinomonas susongensis]
MEVLPAEHIYAEILARLTAARRSGSLRESVEAEVWEPAAESHRPSTPRVGDPCEGCGEPWPCPVVRDLLKSGVVAPLEEIASALPPPLSAAAAGPADHHVLRRRWVPRHRRRQPRRFPPAS